MGKCFQEAFCAQHGVLAKDFETLVFRRCLYPHARFVAWALRFLAPRYFALDFATIRRLGEVSTMLEAQDEIRFYSDSHRQEFSLLRTWLKVRVSGKRLLHLIYESLSKETNPSVSLQRKGQHYQDRERG